MTLNNENRKSFMLGSFMPSFIFLVAFLFYWRTIAPGIYWGDGIEILSASYVMGVLHPTGYPLMMILVKFFTMLPFGTIALRANLFCAFTSACCSVVFYLLVRDAIKYFILNSAEALKRETEIAVTLISAGGAMIFSAGKTLWFHSITTEVYVLHLFFVLILFKTGLKFFSQQSAFTFTNAIKSDDKSNKKSTVRSLYFFFFFLGLSFSNHLMTIAMIMPACLILYLIYKGKKSGKSFTKTLFICAILFLIPLSLYLILILRAKTNPPLNWGDPDNMKNFFWSISGGEFKIYRFLKLSPGVSFTFSTYMYFFYTRLMSLILWLPEQWAALSEKGLFVLSFAASLPLIIISAFGAVTIFRKNIYAGLFIVLPLMVSLLYIFTYNIADIEAYFLSLYPIILLFILTAFAKIFFNLYKSEQRQKQFLFAFLFFLFGFVIFSSGIKRNDLSYSANADSFAFRSLSACDFDSIILTEGDNDIYPLWYIQTVENYRKDVLVLGTNFMRYEWYKNYLPAEKIKEYELVIKDSGPFMDAGAYYYFIYSDIIWKNLKKCSIYGYIDHEILKRHLTLKPVMLVLTEEEYFADSASQPLKNVLIKYENKNPGENFKFMNNKQKNIFPK